MMEGSEWRRAGRSSGSEWQRIERSGGSEWQKMEGRWVAGINARRDRDEDGVWRPVGCATQVRSDMWRPVARFAVDGESSAVLMAAGSLLGVTVVAGPQPGGAESGGEMLPTGEVSELGQIEAEVIGVDRIEDGMVRVFLSCSPSVYVTYIRESGDAGRWQFTMHGAMPKLPDLHIEVAREQTFSEPVPGLRLSGAVGAGASRLAVSDAITLSAHVTDAYKRLSAQALQSGYGLQPVLARYRVEDVRGATIEVGPTVLVSSTGGFQCAGGADFRLDTATMTLADTSIMAKGYVLKLMGMREMGAPWNRLIGRVVVETSDPIEPFDLLGSVGRGTVSSDGGTTTVTMPLPGGATGSAGQTAAMQTKIARTLEDDRWKIQAVAYSPFRGAVSTLSVPLSDGVTVKGVRAPAVADSERYRTMYETPGGMVVATDPCVSAFDGYKPEQLATLTASGQSGAWRAVITVTLREPDGSERQAVSASAGTAAPPQGFSPLLCYPDARAVSMKIAMQTAGGVVEQTYPLRRIPGRDYAYYIGAEFQPMLPAGLAAALEAPPSTVSARHATGVLVFSTYATLAESSSRHRLSTGPITTVAEWPTGAGSWDFSRTKIALGSGSGVYQATFTADNRMHAVRRMSAVPVSGPFVECTDAEGRFLLVRTAAGVMQLRGSRVQMLDSRLAKAVSVAFGGAEGEYWWIEETPSGGERLMRGWYYRKRLECSEVSYPAMGEPQTLQNRSGRLLVGCTGGLFDASREQWVDGAMPFGVTVRHDLSHTIFRPGELLKINLFGSSIKGEAGLWGDRGSRVAEPLVRFSIEGELNEGIVVPVATGGRGFLETKVDVLAGADAELRPTQRLRKKK